MDKRNIKVKQFINNCKLRYGKPIDPKQNAMEVISKKIDIKKVNGFSWKNMGQSWGMAEADLLKTVSKETGSLRVLWYRSFKLYSMRVMGDDLDLDKANALLSTGLAGLVRTGDYMYEDFSVEDFAYAKDFREFIKSLNVIMFVEKSSEFPKFVKSCEILGIKVLLQGSGRPNFSSTEYIYTHFFNGRVDEDHPIRILTLTDFDYDGIKPIAGGFVKQMVHYTPYVKVGRVGLESMQIAKNRLSVNDALYEVKQDNKNLPKDAWMEENLFKSPEGRYLGAEVECNPFKFYYPLIWDALKETGVTYQDFLDQQYENVQPDARAVAKEIATELLSEDLEGIDEQIANLNEQRSEMILTKMDEIKEPILKIKNDPNFIKCQTPKPESSITDALKNQISWNGGISYTKQRREFITRVKKVLNK
jgi:hypothetical protein